MIQYLLYVASKKQISEVEKALAHIQAKKLDSHSGITKTYVLKHKFLKNISLQIDLLDDVRGITPHLKRCHVDLLVYDERQSEGLPAIQAIKQIRDDIAEFSNLWGPDFLFPTSRMAVILAKGGNESRHAFKLGRLGVRDVLSKPASTGQVIIWLQRIVTKELSIVSRSGIALSGGGIEGLLFQLGVLNALEKSMVDGKSIYDCEVFTGISSGSIAASIVAGGIPTQEVILSLVGKSQVIPHFSLIKLFDIASVDIGKRLAKNLVSWAGLSPELWRKKILHSIPSGFFKGQYLLEFFKGVFEIYGKKDSFSDLKKKLFIGVTDQDSYRHHTFGKDPENDPSISEAIRASSSIPSFFTPVELGGKFYIDGQITKTCNLSDVVNENCKLCFIIDPFKPYGEMKPGENNKKGGYHSIVQTLKALVASRFEQSLAHIGERYPEVDFLVFQPDEECAKLMQGSPMKTRIRSQVIETAYKTTIRKLRDRHMVYQSVLSKYGFKLRSQSELSKIEYQLWEKTT